MSQHLITIPNPSPEPSLEARDVEFEVEGPKRSLAKPVTLPACALYYICEDMYGVCMYRRQDVPITVSTHEMQGKPESQ